MTEKDRNLTKDMINDSLKPLIQLIESRDILMNVSLNNIDGRLDKIEKHLEKLNSKVAQHEKVINQVGEERLKGCIQAKDISDLKENMITTRAVWKAVGVGIIGTSTLVGIVAGIFKILHL